MDIEEICCAHCTQQSYSQFTVANGEGAWQERFCSIPCVEAYILEKDKDLVIKSEHSTTYYPKEGASGVTEGMVYVQLRKKLNLYQDTVRCTP